MSKEKTATFAGFQSCMEAECPGHALEHVGDQQGTVMPSRAQTMHFAGPWANMEPPPSFSVLVGEVPSSVATRRQASHPSTPSYLLFSHPPHYFPHTCAPTFFSCLPLPLHPPGFTEHLLKCKPRSCISCPGRQCSFHSCWKRQNVAVEPKMAVEGHEDGIQNNEPYKVAVYFLLSHHKQRSGALITVSYRVYDHKISLNIKAWGIRVYWSHINMGRNDVHSYTP